MKHITHRKTALSILVLASASLAVGCSSTSDSKVNSTPVKNSSVSASVPASKFDLSQWKITVPLDEDKNGKIDEIDVKAIQSYSHPDYFYLDDNGHMVFATPNKATTTSGSSNTRSELRQMLRGDNTKIKTKGPGNNFVLAKHSLAKHFAAVGGKMEASLKVDHVARRAGHPDKPPAYSVVVGQIHAGKDKNLLKKTNNLFGWGNEPIKVYYKKWPHHDTGSVFWNYERNLAKDDPNRTDIAYPVWGNTWKNPADPGAEGIKLGEEFSYVINVHENVMHLEFSAKGKPTVKYSIDLTNNVDAYGKVDELDNPHGYTLDWNYFKAGAYNQCSTKDAPGGWYTACPGTGDWQTDKANGDYTQVTFTRLKLSESTAP
ncbi:polysaccharide lyase family 7 protein [Saccharobesus litoralis]|uniref:Polysaccharide lyase family 7 protein n=1 Tax=Saccharobesus litoralis TaxID=2172099 RepID=A0A2S0VRE7_9ALTE|nr:polysaccharide lyase family 7 protein [Saccharobesus litoralis]AWB66660.1 polysaccharide lyase family 7 protein [Saccharobesus litoralis]